MFRTAGRAPSIPPISTGSLLLIAASITFATLGCARIEDTRTETPCAVAVGRAAAAIEIDDQKALLDVALLQCRSLADLGNEIARHPGLIGHSVERFAEIRCGRVDDDAILAAPVCAASGATSTTTPAAPDEADVVFVGDTLDGRRVELRPGPNIAFVGDVPEVVQQTVDIASEAGCQGVAEQRDRWFAFVDDPVIGDEASVYTRHAENVAEYLGCALPPPGTAPIESLPAQATG